MMMLSISTYAYDEIYAGLASVSLKSQLLSSEVMCLPFTGGEGGPETGYGSRVTGHGSR